VSRGRSLLLVVSAWLAAIPAAAADPAAPAAKSRASGSPLRVRALALPGRQGHAGLAAAARRTAAALANRLGAIEETSPPPGAIDDALQRGIQLSRAGALDDAAAALDPALDAGARALPGVGDAALFIAAHTTRIAIALARGEAARADALFDRLLQYDPGLALSPDEDSPRMRGALARARQRAGQPPALAVATLGDACAGAVLVVARGLVTGATELSRFDDCRLVAQAVVQARFDPERAVALLDPSPRRPGRPSTRPAAPVEASAPFYRRVWFWTAVGVVVGGGAAVIYASSRGPEPVTVVPRF
jgi:hypothetical protein